MGFSDIAPRTADGRPSPSIDVWSQRADAAILVLEPPWDALLDGVPPEELAAGEPARRVDALRARGHEIWVYLEPADGLDRQKEAAALRARRRSLAETAVQHLFRRYALAVVGRLRPDHLGLALETNLIRVIAPDVYAVLRETANAAARDVRAMSPSTRLSVSVQVDFAWGWLGDGSYRGVEPDLADFPFVDELGLSSYPYLTGFSDPADLPLDYYRRLVGERRLPVAVTEGGWSSAGVGPLSSSPEMQARYVARHARILDAAEAIAVFQLSFTDLDLEGREFPPGSWLPLFTAIGFADTRFNPKPALHVWDAVFARPWARRTG